MSPKALNLIICIGGLGLLMCLLSSYAGWAAYPFLSGQEIKSRIILTNGSQATNALYKTQKWVFNVYVFNVTNPEEVALGDMPVMEELGPYVYDLYRSKVDIDLSNKDTLSFRVENKFYFNSNKSGEYKETDVITSLNVPLLVTALLWEEDTAVRQSHLNSTMPDVIMENQELFVDVTVGDLLFNGIEVTCDNRTHSQVLICEKIYSNQFSSFNKSPSSQDYAFSYFQKVNSSLSEVYEVERGNTRIADLGKVVTHGGYPYLNAWESGSACRNLQGTEGSIFPPMDLETELEVYFYTPELCMYTRYVRPIHLKKGETLHFYFSNTNFALLNNSQKAMCRCQKNTREFPVARWCILQGVYDATHCYGEPFVNSYPRLTYTGYKINLTKQVNYPFGALSRITIEPRTGMPLIIIKKMQRNIVLKQLEFQPFSKVSLQLFPLFWTEEHYSDELKQYYNNEFIKLKKIDNIVMPTCWIFFGFGCLLLFAAYLLWVKHEKQRRKDSISLWHGINRRRKAQHFY